MLDVATEYQQQAAYRAVIEALDEMGEGLMIIQDQRFVFVNAALCRLCGYSERELLGLPLFTCVFHTRDRDRILRNWRRRIAGEPITPRYETALQHRDGSEIAVEISVSVLRRDGESATVVAVRDIRERKRAEQALRDQQERLERLLAQRTAELAQEQRWSQVTLESVGDAVVATDDGGAVSYMNPAAERLTGWTHREAAGRRIDDIFNLAEEGGEPAISLVRLLGELSGDGESRPGLLTARDGRQLPVELSAAPIRDRRLGVVGAVVVLHDISEHRRLTDKLSYQASHDSLTGLVNRAEFERRLVELVADAHRGKRQHALCYLDLDQFKVVNDTCGHGAGDELLRQLSSLLRARIRRSDTLARLGGDEFGMLLDNCPMDRAAALASELLEVIQAFRYNYQGKSFSVGASIGLVSLSSELTDATEALRAADAACYLAKESGRNRIQVYRADDRELHQRQGQMHWVAELNEALAENRFRLYYQPIVPIADPTGPHHWEILLRLEDAAGEIVGPGAFIPAAERYNLMPSIDRWVVREVVAWLAQTPQAPEVVSINLSGATFAEPAMVDEVRQLLADSGVAGRRLCFEITETRAIANIADAVRFMDALAEAGCSFALDDFGSGMSSFAYLKNLPVRYLKIDGNFVRDIVDDQVDRAMVDAIARVGMAVGQQTIAEYVENEQILAVLGELGVDYAQGYGIARPAPLPGWRPSLIGSGSPD